MIMAIDMVRFNLEACFVWGGCGRPRMQAVGGHARRPLEVNMQAAGGPWPDQGVVATIQGWDSPASPFAVCPRQGRKRAGQIKSGILP